MTDWGPIATAGLAGMLVLTLGGEVRMALPWFDRSRPVAATPPEIDARAPAASQATAAALPDTGAILGRPLFNWNRRPGGTSGNAETSHPLPRLSGILVSESGRYAIFAAAPGGKPVVVAEGGVIGGFTIGKIAADHIELEGAQGHRSLHTSFGLAPSPPLATPDAS